MLPQLIVSGIAVGSLYALTAVGIVLVFKTTRTINLAQGVFGMMAAFLALMFIKAGFSFPLAVLFAVLAIVVLAALMERLVMRPIENSDWLTLFTATLAVFYILHGVAGGLWGRATTAFPNPFPLTPVSIGGVFISQAHLILIFLAVAIGFGLYFFFRFTKYGIAMRAVTEDREAARLMGIPVRFIVTLTWVIAGGMLGAISGLLLAPILFVNPEMMNTVLLKGYIAAIFGGLYSLPGAVLGAIVIGLAENVLGGYLGVGFKDTFPFLLMIIILAIRPTGLFGARVLKEA